MKTIVCDCGFRLGIKEENLEEIQAGVWGNIPCPKCTKRLNDKIKNTSEVFIENLEEYAKHSLR
jgi:hypothetical protein